MMHAVSALPAVMRSKGFMWMASSHATAYYWSHAGQHFEIRDEGDWWSAVPDEEWPEAEAQRNIILQVLPYVSIFMNLCGCDCICMCGWWGGVG